MPGLLLPCRLTHRTLGCLVSTLVSWGCDAMSTGPSPTVTAVGLPRIDIQYQALGPAPWPFSPFGDSNVIINVSGDLSGILEQPVAPDDTLDGGRLVVVEYGCWPAGTGCRSQIYRSRYGTGERREASDGRTSISTTIHYLSPTVDLELSVETAHGASIRLRPQLDHLRPPGRYRVEHGRIRAVPREP